MPENKVVFGLKNVHYSVITTDATTGGTVYGTPVALKGAVEISLDPRGETSDFYADDVLYFTHVANNGYEASLSIANLTNEFRLNVLGEINEGEDNVLTENANVRPKRIAFLFEFDGDQKATRYVLYNCSVTRPSISSATKTESAEPSTMELSMVVAPRPEDGIVKRQTTVDTPASVYDAWYDSVFVPTPPAPTV